MLTSLACSTKKDNFANRNFQALNTEYNVLYNGGIALNKGIMSLKAQYKDNYLDILPVERQLLLETKTQQEGTDTKPKNADFDRAEEKATKAIQRRSMNIDGSERNPQIDEAHLLLGKARYYDQRFVPALEAFNYILYKYPKSDKIYEAKVWREKTNIRLDNDALAIKNLSVLLSEIKLKNQVFADANAILAQAFLKTNQKDSAIFRLKKAIRYTKQNEEKARYRFITGQLYDKLDSKDSAFAAFQSVIDMKRKSPRQYVIESKTRQANEFDALKGDTTTFIENFKKLLLDRENRPFLDVLNHQLGLYYDKNKNKKQAKKYYNKSLRTNSTDNYLNASNYRNIADINFYDAKYGVAGKYYDSTLVKLQTQTREYNTIKKKRENLDDVIKYENIAQANDSVLNLLSMSDSGRNAFFENYTAKLKKQDEVLAKLAEKAQNLKNNNINSVGNTSISDQPLARDQNLNSKDFSTSNASGSQSNFYFYNQTTVAFGRLEFRKNWGDRILKENWRTSVLASNDINNSPKSFATDSLDIENKKNEVEKYTTKYYINKLPKKQSEIDKLKTDRNFAYFQLGSIYKEKFNEYKLAQNKLETLLTKNPEERLVLPTMYNLFKIYEIIDPSKALAMKELIISKYPYSRYAQILQNKTEINTSKEVPNLAYLNLYEQYNIGNYNQVLTEIDKVIEQFNGDEIVSKFELLKANVLGKVNGLSAYKKALNFVSLNYPNSPEGKQAEVFLNKDIPEMEGLQFNLEKPLSWKIIYKIENGDDRTLKPLQEKIARFIGEKISSRLSSTLDMYNSNESFLVIHGVQSEDEAKAINSILKDYKIYKIEQTAIIISSDNYRIVQIKKNLEEYLLDPKKVAIPVAIKPFVTEKVIEPKVDKKPQEVIENNQQSINPPGFSPEPAVKLKEEQQNQPSPRK